jgi:hypothetical protein
MTATSLFLRMCNLIRLKCECIEFSFGMKEPEEFYDVAIKIVREQE